MSLTRLRAAKPCLAHRSLGGRHRHAPHVHGDRPPEGVVIGTYVAVDDEQVGGEPRAETTGDGGEAQHLGGVRIRAV